MPQRTRRLAFRERAVLTLVLVGLAVALAQGNWLWRLDQLLYDVQLRLWSRPAPDDIVIIAIDEASLSRYGRWPWPRQLHARLLDKLTAEHPRAVAMDIIFAEPDLTNPVGDSQLAAAIARNGRVVLPVLMEQGRGSGPPLETLPLPVLAEVAAGMGHVHVELDPDGIARSLYLHEGLGNAFWPHLSLALLNVAGTQPIRTRTEHRISTSPMLWVRAEPLLIPYAGPPGHFKRISYAQVTQGEFAPGTFTNKYVLVGTTAAGVGDALPTPVSGYSRSMPGVEINANVLSMLRDNIHIAPISDLWRMFLSGLFAFLPVLLLPMLSPRSSLLAAASLLMLTFVATTGLLWWGHFWFPPAAALCAVALSYPLWSWRRLELTMRYLNQELDELSHQRRQLSIRRETELQPALRFLSDLLPIEGWALIAAHGEILESAGSAPELPNATPTTNQWTLGHRSLWKVVDQPRRNLQLGINWQGNGIPTAQERALLDSLANKLAAPTTESKEYEVLQARISQVQAATHQLLELRGFVDHSLSNMSDGVLVTDSLGQVLMSNARASWYLRGDDHAQLTGEQLPALLSDMTIRDGGNWTTLLQIALLEHTRVQAAVRHRNGRDLLVQIAPLTPDPLVKEGLILNFSDISPLTSSERKRDELLNFLSHDLRSPLVSLLALLELAKSKTSIAELQMEMERMTGYTEKTLNLAEQFLQLARAEGNQDLPFHDVDMINVVWNSCEQLWGMARARDITLQQSIEVEDAWVQGDGNLLERALINLLTNAIKYSPPGATVTISLARDKKHHRCCVIDHGLGIPTEDLPRLFDRFQRVHRRTVNDQDGAGLGLAFVAAVISRHGGEVEVQSVEGQGSRFCLLLNPASDAPTP